MKPLLKCVWRPLAAGALLLAASCSLAWGQASGASAPSAAHEHGTSASKSLGSKPTTSLTSEPLATSGQSPLSWQDANRAVAQFPRGHVDLLRWEQKNLPLMQDAPPQSDASQLSLERATRLALQGDAKWLKPGMSSVEKAQVGQEVAALRREVQKLWVDAVATQQSVGHNRDILAVAQAGAELGQRMAQVGNWSRARQIQEELSLWDARTRLDRAQLQADRALHALWQRVGAEMTVQAMTQQLPLHLPLTLPLSHPVDASSAKKGGSLEFLATALTADVAALQTQALQAHLRLTLDDLHAHRLMAGLGLSNADLQAIQKSLHEQAEQLIPVWDPRTMRWGHGTESALQARLQADRLARQVRSDVQLALNAFQVARQTEQHTRADVLRLHTELSQQTLLRYNGMLKSTWDLLASARTRIDSVDAALQAQRQVWLAHADLLAVLSGLPYTASDLSGAEATGTSASNNKPGH